MRRDPGLLVCTCLTVIFENFNGKEFSHSNLNFISKIQWQEIRMVRFLG